VSDSERAGRCQTIETDYVYDSMQLFAMQLQSRRRQYSKDLLLGDLKQRKVSITPMHCTDLVFGDERGAEGEPMFISTNDFMG
jgi:hypothetical protein